jgi:alkaline phosphatase D
LGKLLRIYKLLSYKEKTKAISHLSASFFLFFLTLQFGASAQEVFVSSGPMPCYSEKREVLVWLQTTASARVSLKYYNSTSPNNIISTDTIKTEKETGFTAHFVITRLEPGSIYYYDLYLNDKKIEKPYKFSFTTQKLWEWRTDPPEFSFITGSCAYINDEPYDRPGNNYGGHYEVFQSIAKNKGDFMLWLGDNVYLREAEFFTRDGMIYRYSHSRAIPEMQEMLASMHHYAIWDDHDFGPNDSDRGWRNKTDALDVFKMFWGNPSYGIDGKPGIATSFQYNDVDFFLLDDRYNKSPNDRKNGERTILGKDQREWLIDALASSQAPFKIVAVGVQFLNPAKVYENYSNFEEERQWLLDQIALEKIEGVIFLTGDRHSSELDVLSREGAYPLHDFTISPLSAGPSNSTDKEVNPLRRAGTLVTERNFAKFFITGKRGERVLKCTVYNVGGKELWSYTINASDLQYPKVKKK